MMFSSEEGQWMVVESSIAARLIMILLDSSHSNVSMEEIQKEPLVPEKDGIGSPTLFMMAGDGIKHRNIVHEVTSKYTGPIIVDDVIYENVDKQLASLSPSEEPVFRRLVFQRSSGLVQSEAFLTSGGTKGHGEAETKTVSDVKSKKKETGKADKSMISGLSSSEVDHTVLVGAYHTGIVAGFSLISSYLECMASSGGKVETVVIGLGAGLLPMFMHSYMDFLHVEVVELDPAIPELAKGYFGFCEDERLKIHVAHRIQFLKEFTSLV